MLHHDERLQKTAVFFNATANIVSGTFRESVGQLLDTKIHSMAIKTGMIPALWN